MKQFLVGNGLRGFFRFEAEDEDQAWTIGSAIFNWHYPSEHGRTIELYPGESPPLRHGTSMVRSTDARVARRTPHAAQGTLMVGCFLGAYPVPSEAEFAEWLRDSDRGVRRRRREALKNQEEAERIARIREETVGAR